MFGTDRGDPLPNHDPIPGGEKGVDRVRDQTNPVGFAH